MLMVMLWGVGRWTEPQRTDCRITVVKPSGNREPGAQCPSPRPERKQIRKHGLHQNGLRNERFHRKSLRD